jgi:hypothetical protein
MSVHNFVSFLHAAAGVIWIGAAFTLIYLAVRAQRSHNHAELALVIRNMLHFSRAVFMPASGAVLILGLYLLFGVWSFFQFWVLFALIGFAASAVMGAMILGPMVKEYSALEPTEAATPESIALASRIIAVGKADLVILFGLLFAMIIKPYWGNFIVWPLLLIVVGAGVFYFMPRDLLPGQTPLDRTRDFGDEDDDDQ